MEINIICNNCRYRNECTDYQTIQKIREMTYEILPENICKGIDLALEKFEDCDYKVSE